MTPGRDFTKIVETARAHYINLKTDIANASNRIEHIRLSALAQEAQNLLTDLVTFEVGLVYSHTNNVDGHIAGRIAEELGTIDESVEPLDLPEFKSPYNPDLK
tara:strand:- start:11399 stop:11707 length:309 start_codon:yes stop_codon:yes gene_type:complete